MERRDNTENVERYSENVDKIITSINNMYDRLAKDSIALVEILILQYKLSRERYEARNQMLLIELQQEIEKTKQIIFGSGEEKRETTGIDLSLLEGFNKSLGEAIDIFAEGKRIRDMQMTKETVALNQLHQALEEGRKIFSGNDEEKSEMAGITLEILEGVYKSLSEGKDIFAEEIKEGVVQKIKENLVLAEFHQAVKSVKKMVSSFESTVEFTPEEKVEILPLDRIKEDYLMYKGYISDIARGNKSTISTGLIYAIPESYNEISDICYNAVIQLSKVSDYRNRYIIARKTMTAICGLINNGLNKSVEQVNGEGTVKTLGTYPTENK